MEPVPALEVALKEWAVAVEALARGEQIVLLRKGGIHERGGRFRLEHDRFVLFPTFEHQEAELLHPALRERYAPWLERSSAEGPLVFRAWAEVACAVRLDDPEKAFRLAGEHVWNDEWVRMRIAYRPENPLHAVFLRVHELREPVTAERAPRYAGCRSWVRLESPVDLRGSHPAIEEAAFADRLSALRRVLKGA